MSSVNKHRSQGEKGFVLIWRIKNKKKLREYENVRKFPKTLKFGKEIRKQFITKTKNKEFRSFPKSSKSQLLKLSIYFRYILKENIWAITNVHCKYNMNLNYILIDNLFLFKYKHSFKVIPENM